MINSVTILIAFIYMSTCFNTRYRKTKIMSTQLKIDLILNMIYLHKAELSMPYSSPHSH